jgi:hypothetical protein
MEGGKTPYERVGDLGWVAILVTSVGLRLGGKKLESPVSSQRSTRR